MKMWSRTEYSFKIEFEEIGLPENLIHRRGSSLYGATEEGLLIVGREELMPFPGVDEYIGNFIRKHLINRKFKDHESWTWRYNRFIVSVGEEPPLPEWVYDHHEIATTITVEIITYNDEEKEFNYD